MKTTKSSLLLTLLLTALMHANEKSNHFQALCDGGNANSCSILGDMYRDGNEVEIDKSRAIELYEKSLR